MSDQDEAKPEDLRRDQDPWIGEERRKPRSSFVERIGKARARRASDRKRQSADQQAKD